MITEDQYYYNVCKAVAKKSRCLSRQIGAVLVRDGRILVTGYNDPPHTLSSCAYRHKYDQKLKQKYLEKNIFNMENIMDLGTVCPRYLLGYKSGEGLDLCPAVHAERSVLIAAAKNGITTDGAKLYMDCPTPCTPCLVEIIEAGIEEIIFTKEYYYDSSAEYVLKTSGLKYRLYKKGTQYE